MSSYGGAVLNFERVRVINQQINSLDHPTLWEGHSTMIHEIARQTPSGTVPDAIVCNVGGGGLLGGVLRGVNELKWDHSESLLLFE
jgi:threonine dehydratase